MTLAATIAEASGGATVPATMVRESVIAHHSSRAGGFRLSFGPRTTLVSDRCKRSYLFERHRPYSGHLLQIVHG